MRGAAVGGLCLALLGVYVVALALPVSRHFFALAAPAPDPWLVAAGASGVAIAGLALTDDRFVPRTRDLSGSRSARPSSPCPP